jgi:multimeric flavodoxin WrbA
MPLLGNQCHSQNEWALNTTWSVSSLTLGENKIAGGKKKMQKVKILGVVGSPRKNGNTAKLVKKALEGAMTVPSVETELYEMAGRKYHHCTSCYKCLTTGSCVFKDDLQDLVRRYHEADGIIWGAPVYHMAVPASMKAAIDRFGSYNIGHWMKLGQSSPRFSKVCGVLTVGAARYGGEEMVLNFLVNSSLLKAGIVVAPDSSLGCYLGAVGYVGPPTSGPMNRTERLKSKDVVLNDEKGIESAINLGKRVAEVTRIVRAGVSVLGKELPSEYFYTWEEL